MCQASRAPNTAVKSGSLTAVQKVLSPYWNVARSREELEEACAAGPTTCIGVAAGAAYSS